MMAKPNLDPSVRSLPPGQYMSCPYCGGIDLKMVIQNMEGEPIQEMVWCTSCQALGPRWDPQKKLAAAAWNERPLPEGKKLYATEALYSFGKYSSQEEWEEDTEAGLPIVSLQGCPFCAINGLFFGEKAIMVNLKKNRKILFY